ncbi:hypothetical protein EPO05_06130 [Patescibacteria group bacterium]|nr:MAG: hypothetical protein EPO05_06130 [Patescibacteria group bacterium]
MNQGDVYGGSVERHSSGVLVASYTVIPTAPRPGAAPAPFVVSSYEIYQMPTGNGKVILFYDATAAPAAGTAWFGNTDPTKNVQWMAPITGNGIFLFNPGPAGHRYLKGCTIVMSAGTDVTQLQLATANSLMCVDGFPWLV